MMKNAILGKLDNKGTWFHLMSTFYVINYSCYRRGAVYTSEKLDLITERAKLD